MDVGNAQVLFHHGHNLGVSLEEYDQSCLGEKAGVDDLAKTLNSNAGTAPRFEAGPQGSSRRRDDSH